MKPKVTVEKRDTGLGRFAQLINELHKAQPTVKVGVLDNGGKGSEMRDGGYTNAQIAAVHEFGSSDGKIPQRSFLRSTFDANRETYQEDLKKLLEKVVDGKMSVEKAFNIMGAKIAADVKKRVTAGAPIPPPNAPAIYARKAAKGQGSGGDVRTLIDTGRMIASVTWSVTMGRSSHAAE